MHSRQAPSRRDADAYHYCYCVENVSAHPVRRSTDVVVPLVDVHIWDIVSNLRACMQHLANGTVGIKLLVVPKNIALYV
jgi:hypothetical protein